MGDLRGRTMNVVTTSDKVSFVKVMQIELTDECIKKLADALKQKTGKWIQAEDIPTEYVVCTNCKGLGKSYMDYCWHCGSRNRGDTDDEI